MTDKVRELVAGAIHRKNDMCVVGTTWANLLQSGEECGCFEMADAVIAALAASEPSAPSADELMLAVAMVEDEGLWKFDQPKWYEAMAEALLHLRQEKGPSGQPITSAERHLTEHQKAIEEAAGMSLDWPMANAATVAASDLQAKLEALRDELDPKFWVRERLTAILEGKA